MTARRDGFQYLSGFFQIAYVTNDMERAKEVLGQRYGIAHYDDHRSMQFDKDTTIDIANAYVGNVMIELIQAHGPGTSIYDTVLPTDGSFAIRHHHFGHLVKSEEEFAKIEDYAAERRIPVAYKGGVPGVIGAIYLDTRPELGHYLEYIHATSDGLAFLDRAPRN